MSPPAHLAAQEPLFEVEGADPKLFQVNDDGGLLMEEGLARGDPGLGPGGKADVVFQDGFGAGRIGVRIPVG